MKMVQDRDTSLGDRPKAFPETTWQLVARFISTNHQDRAAGFESLAQRYWKPVYRHIRMQWRKSNEDAKDLTQTFFQWLLESDALQRYDPDRGAFRRFVKGLLRHFVQHQAQAIRAWKRGGRIQIIRLEGIDGIPADPDAADPERMFDRNWALEIAAVALDRVRVSFRKKGREKAVRAYEEYELQPKSDRPTYAAIGKKLDVSENDVRNYLREIRDALRTAIRAEIADTVVDPKVLEEEWNALFRS